MAGSTPQTQTAQLDKAEREHLEDVIAAMRERVESNVEYQLSQQGVDDGKLAEAIELEAVDGHDRDEAVEQYVTGVGYTIVNRLAALRCMEVREFVNEEVTVFKENGLTPAAETLVHEEFLLEDEAILAGYRRACDELAAEIEILFDRSSAYSLVDPDADTFEDLCELVDDVPDEVWRADDVLGWVYEYYNRPVVEALDAKNTLEPADVGPANQFYTPHWVVRMLTDNSLGKLYLEATGRESAADLSIEERKNRPVTPEDAPDVRSLCTYLIPDENREVPGFDGPEDLRVIDPACGSGHFLLYAFDVLERIWWAETDLDRCDIPAKILEHNLYGVDIDLRSCQLAAFNLYLKARTRAEAEGAEEFEMPNVGIVCADARVAEVESAVEVFEEITERPAVRESLAEVMEQFQNVEALGSLLDVEGAISAEFLREQTSLFDSFDGPHTLNAFLTELRAEVERRTADSFVAQNLRSFIRLLVILTHEYDVALMNPPYGSGGRMPDDVQEYVGAHYDYTTEYYINFFETCDRLVNENGRIGMLVPWSFMFNKSFQDFREDFIGGRGSFDFFAEFGYDILDNATVGTVGTVVRSEAERGQTGTFIRLPDVPKGEKEKSFLQSSFVDTVQNDVPRLYNRELSEFDIVPGTPLSYWVPKNLRNIFDSDVILDANNAGIDAESFGAVKQGLVTGNDGRFTRSFWEISDSQIWFPFAKGGTDAWILPRIKKTVLWNTDGKEIKRYHGSRPQNTQFFFRQGITYNRVKRSGRRFGYLHSSSVFADKGSAVFPKSHGWNFLSYANSRLFTYLMLTQTSERMWEIGQVSKVPWKETLADIEELETLSKEAVGHLISKRQYDFVSPHYSRPVLLAAVGISDPLAHYDHPHRDLREELALDSVEKTVLPDASLSAMGVTAARHIERIEATLQHCADAIDEAVFECFGISDDQRETVLREIALRTIEDPREREEHDPAAITEPTDKFPEMVKDLLLHLTLRIVHEDEDGVVPLSTIDREDDLLARIVDEFERLFGAHAPDRLAEVDQVLGSRTPDEEAYPNLRAWLTGELFDYHVTKFDRTPILWRLTTERLVTDPVGEGFGCLVDYHSLDSGLFDRLQNRYLEPRKTLLRERRSAANRRMDDESLSTTERASATDEYDRCESGLAQIEAFEDRLAELARPTPREWPDENREIAREASEAVAEFREETKERLETLDKLAATEDMTDLFSPSFYDTVEKNRDEWLNALADLETAFEAYTAEGGEPIEAHRYDLFEYFDDLAGSAHYASNGILFTTYYFGKFESPDQALDAVPERQRLLGELASGLDSYKERAEAIRAACDEISSDIPSDWADRAIAEITTAGYRPNHKHGVAINIRPLADAEVVPEIVDRKVT